MALKDKKITEAGINQHGVVSAPDHLTGTPTENKKVFDRLVRALVAQSVNGLIDDLAGTGGAEEIGVSPINGLSGSNVQELLAAMKALLDKRIAEAGVASFKGRTGPVMPQSGDYTAAMVGAAPAGYGLGGEGTEVSDWNNATNCGFYRDSEGSEAKHSPFVGYWASGYTASHNIGSLVQTAFSNCGYGDGRWFQKQRIFARGAWGEWEWVNPPLELGKEYRTTERYNGKPVYCKLVSFALGAGKKTHNLGVSNVANAFIDVSKSRVSTADPSITSILPTHGWIEEMRTNANGGCEIIVTTTADLTGYTAYICVKYTKSTD